MYQSLLNWNFVSNQFSIHFYGFQFQNFPYISLRTFPYLDTYQLCYSRTLVKNIWLKKTKKGLSTCKIPRLKRYQVSKSCRRHLERGLKADQVVKLKTKKFPVIYTSHFKCLKQNFFRPNFLLVISSYYCWIIQSEYEQPTSQWKYQLYQICIFRSV